MSLAGLNHAITVVRTHRHGFLAEDLFPGFRGCDGHFRVEEGGRADHDGFDIGLGKQNPVVGVPVPHAEFLPEYIELRRPDVRPGDQFEAIVFPDGIQLMGRNARAAEDTEFNHGFFLCVSYYGMSSKTHGIGSRSGNPIGNGYC